MGCNKCGGDESQYCDYCKDYLPDIAKLIAEKVAEQREEGIYKIMNLHVRAMACHCECMGMNAENSYAVCRDIVPPYNDDHYLQVMKKWGLVNEKGESVI